MVRASFSKIDMYKESLKIIKKLERDSKNIVAERLQNI